MSIRFSNAREFVDLVTGQDTAMSDGFAAKKELRRVADKDKTALSVLSGLVRSHVGADAASLTTADTYATLLGNILGEITTGKQSVVYESVLTKFLDQHGFIDKSFAKNTNVGETHSHTSGLLAPVQHEDDSMDALDSLLVGDDFSPLDGEGEAARDKSATKPDNVQDYSGQNSTQISKSTLDAADTSTQITQNVSNIETAEVSIDPLTELGPGIFEVHWPGSGSGRQRIASGELMKLPGILPPAPLAGTSEHYGAWLDGDVWNPLAISLKLDLKDGDNLDDLFEMQSEFYALPESAMKTYSARSPANPETGRTHAQFIHYAARDLGRVSHTYDVGKEMLAKAVARYFEENEPSSADFLNRVGYTFKCGTELIDTVCGALDIQDFFLSDGPAEAGQGPLSDLRGAISPAARLDVPYLLDRVLLLHFGSGVSICSAMHDTLIELRHAQLCRHIGRDVSPFEFDPAFKRDWFTELNEYEMSREEEYSPSPM